MGETDVTFSKRKSSSSSSLKQKKKKRSHDLSKVDRKSKKRSRSKIRKSKSKKLRRRHDSTSCSDSDDDGDENLNSLSLSDSFLGDHKRRRSKSRTRNDGKKKSKKRSRKRSSSSDSESERDERCRVKKRKCSKRKVDVETKKKSRRKKPKRDVKVNSPSSSSPSCSISCGASSCDDTRPYLSKRSKYRSPSCSSISRSSKEDDYQTEEKLGLENTSRRLRSVITVVKGPSENEVELDKEEIVHDQDDYPSCRSNDSDDAKMKIDEEIKGAQEYAVMGIDVDDRYEASYPSADEYEGPKQGVENKKDDFTDAEKILRQRALENFKKFREELKLKATSDPKEQKDDAVKQLPPEITGLLPHNGGAKVPSAVKVSQENIGPIMLKVDDCSSQHGRRTEAPVLVERKEVGRKLVSTNKGADQIGMIRKLRNSISSMQDDKKRQEGKYTSEDTKKNSQPSTLVLARESLDLRSSLKQVPTSQQGLKSNPDSNAAEISKPSVNIRDNSDKEVSNNASVSSVTDPSCIKPETGEQSSKDVQGETKDASQYEQKTMSVMRGGELVQVNYKVYIPKKTPALARRQLRR